MAMTEKGSSTTFNRGQFQCEKFYSNAIRDFRFQWDYRDINGELHSGITKTQEDAIENAKKHGYNDKLETNLKELDYNRNYNKGNDCDVCINQFFYGKAIIVFNLTDGNMVGCKCKDDNVECNFIEFVEE